MDYKWAIGTVGPTQVIVKYSQIINISDYVRISLRPRTYDRGGKKVMIKKTENIETINRRLRPSKLFPGTKENMIRAEQRYSLAVVV